MHPPKIILICSKSILISLSWASILFLNFFSPFPILLLKKEQNQNKMRRGMSRWQEISRRHCHCHREPQNEPDPLFIYYNAHLKGNKKLSTSAVEVCSLRTLDLLGCSVQMCLLITKAEFPGNLLIYVKLCQLFAQLTLKSEKRGEVSQRSSSLCPSGPPPALFDVHFSSFVLDNRRPEAETSASSSHFHKSVLILH